MRLTPSSDRSVCGGRNTQKNVKMLSDQRALQISMQALDLRGAANTCYPYSCMHLNSFTPVQGSVWPSELPLPDSLTTLILLLQHLRFARAPFFIFSHESRPHCLRKRETCAVVGSPSIQYSLPIPGKPSYATSQRKDDGMAEIKDELSWDRSTW